MKAKIYTGPERSPDLMLASFSLEILGGRFGVFVDATVSAQSPLSS